MSKKLYQLGANDEVTVPTDKATTEALGLVKPDGETITVDENGVIKGAGNYTVTFA